MSLIWARRFIHRIGPSILNADLPPKREYIVLLQLTPLQKAVLRAFVQVAASPARCRARMLAAPRLQHIRCHHAVAMAPRFRLQSCLTAQALEKYGRSLFRDRSFIQKLCNSPEKAVDDLTKVWSFHICLRGISALIQCSDSSSIEQQNHSLSYLFPFAT